MDSAMARGKRILITLPDGITEELEDLAKSQGRSLAGLCAFLAELGLMEYKKSLNIEEKK